MEKKYFVEIPYNQEEPAGELPEYFAVTFADRYAWEGRLASDQQRYNYNIQMLEKPFSVPEGCSTVSEDDFFRHVGKKATTIRHFIAAYMNYLEGGKG
jgi:hypothetical protein